MLNLHRSSVKRLTKLALSHVNKNNIITSAAQRNYSRLTQQPKNENNQIINRKTIEDFIVWMNDRVAKGFGKFKKDKGGEGEKKSSSGSAGKEEVPKTNPHVEKKGAEGKGRKAEEASEAKEGKKDNSNESSNSSFKNEGNGGIGGGGKKNNDENNKRIQEVGQALVVASIVTAALYGGLSKDNAKEISWQEFKTKLLAAGEVERIVVVNNTRAQVVLRDPEEKRAGENWDTEATEKEQWTSNKEERKINTNPKYRTPYYFTIGSIEGLERKLEETQREMGIGTHEFVPVQYTNEINWGGEMLRFLPTLLFWGGVIFILSRGLGGGGAGGGGGMGGGNFRNMFNIGKVNPATNKGQKIKITFDDVAGCEEAKAEIMEFVQFLKNPDRFTKLGAKIPKGALLVGPPGTGKTLLAKATAGESNVPFFSMSGSDFIEMFVGVGPSRVRDLFKKARENAPCIVFIDEIDAVARARSKGGFSGGNDERENTLNQLLVEMDGFSTTEGVVVLAGTNRADILDKAILRPGRFDRQITVDRPDIKGRMQIFKVHLKGKVLHDPVDDIAKRMASLTPGFAGADIANICNEAAIQAARKARDSILLEDFETATDRVIGGLEKRNSVMTPEEKKCVAYHEAGHAIAGWFLEHADPLLKVTIIPRSNGALGFAQYLPKEMSLQTTEQFQDIMCMALGGRIAEEICFGQITNGASNDLHKVTKIAQAMVTLYGMSEKVGRLAFPDEKETQFVKPYSEATGQLIDEEIKAIVDTAYARTLKLLTEKKHLIIQVGDLLLEKETISQHDVAAIAGERQWKHPQSYKEFLEKSGKKEEVEEIVIKKEEEIVIEGGIPPTVMA